MTARLIDGKAIAQTLRETIKTQVTALAGRRQTTARALRW